MWLIVSILPVQKSLNFEHYNSNGVLLNFLYLWTLASLIQCCLTDSLKVSCLCRAALSAGPDLTSFIKHALATSPQHLSCKLEKIKHQTSS